MNINNMKWKYNRNFTFQEIVIHFVEKNSRFSGEHTSEEFELFKIFNDNDVSRKTEIKDLFIDLRDTFRRKMEIFNTIHL